MPQCTSPICPGVPLSLAGYDFSFRPPQQPFSVETIADGFFQPMTEGLSSEWFGT